MSKTELQLILEAMDGNATSFGDLAERYIPVITGLVYTQVGNWEVARDITQDVFLKAFVGLSSLQKPDRFGSWIRQIAINQAKAYHRNRSARQTTSLDDEQWPTPETEGTMDHHILKQEILRCVHILPEAPREAVVMHYLVGLAPADAARQLGISRAAFDTRLSRGRDLLRKTLLHVMDEALAEERERVGAYLTGLAGRVKAALPEGTQERVAAAKELALLAARANLPRLGLDLTSPQDATRRKAAQLLGQTGDRRAIPLLLKALDEEEEPPVLATLCRSLAEVGAVEAVPRLQTLARNTAAMDVHKAASEAVRDLERRGASAEAVTDIPVTIGDLQDAGIEAMFMSMLADGRPPVQVQAIDGLGRVESLKAVPALLKILAEADQGYVKLAVAEALGAILGSSRTGAERISPSVRAKAVEALAGALGDPDLGVVAEAGRALTLIGWQGDEGLRSAVMERFFVVIKELVLKPGPWWVTFPPMLGVWGSAADMACLLRFLQREEIPHTRKGPLGNAVELMARPGQSDVIPLLLETVRKGIIPTAMVVALGKIQDRSVIPFLQECLGPLLPFEPQAHPKFTLEQQYGRVHRAAAHALAGYPDGASLLEAVWQRWRAGGLPGEQALLALLGGLEKAGAPPEVFACVASEPEVPARVQLSAQAAAKRLRANQTRPSSPPSKIRQSTPVQETKN